MSSTSVTAAAAKEVLNKVVGLPLFWPGCQEESAAVLHFGAEEVKRVGPIVPDNRFSHSELEFHLNMEGLPREPLDAFMAMNDTDDSKLTIVQEFAGLLKLGILIGLTHEYSNRKKV